MAELRLPLEPRLVRWYFEHRESPPLSGAVDGGLVERNERLWQVLCEGGKAVEVLTAVEGTSTRPLPVNTTTGRPARLSDEFTNKEARAAYMRAYMRRRRRAEKP